MEGGHSVCFYTDDGGVAGRVPIWVQAALTTMVRMFERVGLQTDLRKTKAMICTLWFIWGLQGSEAYNRQATGEGPTFQEIRRTRISGEVFGGTMAASSLRFHMEKSHVRVLPQVRWGVFRGEGLEA